MDGQLAGWTEADPFVEAVGAAVGGADHHLDLGGATLGQALQDAVGERAAGAAGAAGRSDRDRQQLGVGQRERLPGRPLRVAHRLQQAAQHPRPGQAGRGGEGGGKPVAAGEAPVEAADRRHAGGEADHAVDRLGHQRDRLRVGDQRPVEPGEEAVAEGRQEGVRQLLGVQPRHRRRGLV